MTQSDAFKNDRHVRAKSALSRRGFATALGGGALVAVLGGGEPMAQTPPNAQLERVNRVGQLVSQRGLRRIRAMRFAISHGQTFRAVSVLNSTTSIPQSAIDLCENDGQLAGILAYLLHGLPIQPAKAMLSRTSIDARQRIAGAGIIRALARVGYDPRDGLVIWQKMQQSGGSGTMPIDTLMVAMSSELHTMGYVT